MKYFGRITYGRDDIDTVTTAELKLSPFVINYTSNWLSIGLTTSPSWTGHFLGLSLHDEAQKRGDAGHKKFRGWLAHCGFWWFKVYLYLYFNGDGRE